MKDWEVQPWTPQLRAEREVLIHFLRGRRNPRSTWLNDIAADQPISDSVCRRVQQFAREWK